MIKSAKAITKAAPKPTAKPTARSAAKPVLRTAGVSKAAAVAPAKIVAVAKATAPAKQPLSGKPGPHLTAIIPPRVVTKTAPKAVSPIVRDSFTMTAADQELLKKCKRDALTAGRDSTKKSEIVRAALRHFAALSPSTQLMEINGLDPVKTGRPKKK